MSKRPHSAVTKTKLAETSPEATQEYLLKHWVGEERDPKTNEVTERRIIANGRPFMANKYGYGEI